MRFDPSDRTENCRVVAFGSAAREHDFTRLAVQHTRDCISSLVDDATRLAGESVRAGWVGELFGEIGLHRRDGFGAHRRRGGVIEVDVAALHVVNLPLGR